MSDPDARAVERELNQKVFYGLTKADRRMLLKILLNDAQLQHLRYVDPRTFEAPKPEAAIFLNMVGKVYENLHWILFQLVEKNRLHRTTANNVLDVLRKLEEACATEERLEKSDAAKRIPGGR